MKYRLFEWSVNRNLFKILIIGGILCLVLMNFYILFEYFEDGVLILIDRYGTDTKIDVEDASNFDYGLWILQLVVNNFFGIALFYYAIILRSKLIKKFYIGAELWAPKYGGLKNIQEKVTTVLCRHLDQDQILYDIDKSNSTILIQSKNVKIKYFINKYRDVQVIITQIQPSSIFAKPENYILPQNLFIVIEIIEKAMITENFMQQSVQTPAVTQIR
jgi:hypothetical protein